MTMTAISRAIANVRAVCLKFRLGDYGDPRCRIFGHAYDPTGAEFYSVYRCDCCGHNGCEYSWLEWIKWKIWIFNRWRSMEWLGITEWWRCTECGGRFGRHDHSFDHLPF